MTVGVLGPIEVRRGGELVDLGGPQQRAVIAHLALEVGRVVPVERLIQRLWGDDLPGAPLGSLQSYVSRLRRVLEPDRAAGRPATVLVSEAPGYVLRIPAEAVDVTRFQSLAQAGREAADRRDPERAAELFEQALALWRGPALAGLGPEDEVRPIVLRLDEERWSVEEDRLDALLALGRHVEAISALHEAVSEHPLRERRWAQLAVALYRAHRQADALRALATARETLVDQLGLDPGPELRELEQRILAQDPTLLAAPLRPEARVRVDGDADAGEGPVVVGRREEWAQVLAALGGAADGPAGLLLIEGEPGIGKTTLLEALQSAAAARGWRVAVGRCAEPGLAPSLWPWIEVVRAIVTGADGAEPVAAIGSSLPALLPGIATDGDHLTPVELAERLADLLAKDAARTPRLVVLDDLHWADQMTLDLLRMVLERIPRVPVLVASGHRPRALVADLPFARALGELARLPSVTRVSMPGLARDDVAQLMTLVSGTEPTSDIAERVHARTGGNPLFVAELARLAGSGGVTGEDVVPDAVRDVVRRRLAQLPPLTTDVLSAAAVLGEDIDLRVLAEASGDSLDDALDALDPAIVTRVLVPDESGAYRFAHALVRDAVLAELSPLRLARMHRRAADAIEAVYGADFDHAEPIAWHRLSALSVDDPERVALALVLAGDVARIRSSYDRSEELLNEALEVALRLAPGPARAAIEVSAMESLLSLETLRSFMGSDLEQIADRIDAFASRNESAALRELAMFTRWSTINALGPASTEEHARRALAEAERSDDLYVIVLGEYVAASQALLAGRNDEACEHFAGCMDAEDTAAARVPPVRTPLPTVAGMAAMAEQLAGRDEQADRLLERLRGSVKQRRDSGVEADFEFFHCLVLAMRDEPNEVAAGSAFSIEVPPRSWMPHFSPSLRVLHVWARVMLGTGAELTAIARDAIQELEDGPTTIGVPAIRTFYGAALAELGESRALDELRRAADVADATGDRFWLAETLRLLAEAEAALGDPGVAPALLERGLSIAREQSAPLLVARAEASISRLVR